MKTLFVNWPAKNCYYLDHGYIERLREILTDDIGCHFDPYGNWR